MKSYPDNSNYDYSNLFGYQQNENRTLKNSHGELKDS